MHSPTATTSVVFPLHVSELAQIMPFAQLVRELGCGRLWLVQSMHLESHEVFAALAGAGLRIPFGCSVSLWPLRHPSAAAAQARSLAALSQSPYVAGIAPGSPAFQATVLPGPLAAPVASTRAYAAALRGLLDGRRVSCAAEGGVVVHGNLPALPAPTVEVGLGVLRPAMAQAAGQVADVAITWLTPPEYVRDTLVPRAHAGALSEGGRAAPRFATVVNAVVARRGRDPLRTVLAGAAAHLSMPEYTGMLRRAGLAVDPSDPVAGARAVVESGTVLVGSPTEIAAGLEHFRACGVDEVILNVCGTLNRYGTDAAVEDLRDVLEAVGDRAA